MIWKNTIEMAIMFKVSSISMLLLFAVDKRPVSGHGFLSFPISRNLKARMDGAEYCPHCLAAGGPGTVSQYVSTWPANETSETAIRHGLCGDYAADSPQKYLETGVPTTNFSPGAVVMFEVTVTAPVCLEFSPGTYLLSKCTTDAHAVQAAGFCHV
eukprot:m.270739 g.270739  ORF g.270739 m.270739 type:complete len:156 (-) comp19739_c0_seq12:1666-2133(-)